MENSIVEFLTQEQYDQKAKAMIESIKNEARDLNRPVYFGDEQFCYEQWPDGRKYVLLTTDITVLHQ